MGWGGLCGSTPWREVVAPGLYQVLRAGLTRRHPGEIPTTLADPAGPARPPAGTSAWWGAQGRALILLAEAVALGAYHKGDDRSVEPSGRQEHFISHLRVLDPVRSIAGNNLKSVYPLT